MQTRQLRHAYTRAHSSASRELGARPRHPVRAEGRDRGAAGGSPSLTHVTALLASQVLSKPLPQIRARGWAGLGVLGTTLMPETKPGTLGIGTSGPGLLRPEPP